MRGHRLQPEIRAGLVAGKRRPALFGAVVVLVAAATLLIPAVSMPSAGAESETVLRPGDIVRVQGTSVTCRVRGGNPPVLECLRLRRLAGTYGVRMSPRRLTAFRVKSATTGETVFSATHNVRRFATCRSGR